MSGPLIAYPSLYGGKYHGTRNGYSASCNTTVLISKNDTLAIHITPGQTRIHPIVCKRCYNEWRKANA